MQTISGTICLFKIINKIIMFTIGYQHIQFCDSKLNCDACKETTENSLLDQCIENGNLSGILDPLILYSMQLELQITPYDTCYISLWSAKKYTILSQLQNLQIAFWNVGSYRELFRMLTAYICTKTSFIHCHYAEAFHYTMVPALAKTPAGYLKCASYLFKC